MTGFKGALDVYGRLHSRVQHSTTRVLRGPRMFTDDYIVKYSTAQHSTAQHSTAQHSTAQHSTAYYSIVQYSIVQYSIVQYTILQYSIVQYSIVQYSIVQYSIVYVSIVQYGIPFTTVILSLHLSLRSPSPTYLRILSPHFCLYAIRIVQYQSILFSL